MKFVLRALFSGIGIVVIVTLVLSVCLWFLGGYLGVGDSHPFDGVVGRLIGITVLWILALLTVLMLLVTGQKRDRKLAEEIVETAEPARPDDEAVTAELGEMRGKLKTALTRLRKSRLGRGHLYLLPWYVIIGPPGAGKTTAIVNSGLKFPLADEMGKEAIGGVGGTRNCDWWFTDEAVLVDTAGRYTTQESDAEADHSAWLGFLGLLKKYRPRQPINGAIVAISLSDLSVQDEPARKSHASAVRRRLHELRDRLGVNFPVYVLFTKADLIAGFSEFFDALGKDAREQVWGFTLPLSRAQDRTRAIVAFDDEFAQLVARLNALSIGRMQAETDPARRSLIASFPAQVATLRQIAHDFLDEIFQDNKFEHRQMLRGVYFTSGTQEGTPIDRLMLGMARTFGIGRQAIGSGQGTGRSYFLTRLFGQVIFPEAGLVSADDKVERRFRWTRRLTIAASVLIALGAGGLWARSYLGNRALTASAEASVVQYRDAVTVIPRSPIGDTDLPLVVPALDTLRGLATIRNASVPTELSWGLYQGRAIGNQAQLTYRAALNQHFLPRLLLRLEEQMQSNINDPQLLYEALKVYLTLGLVGPMNTDLIREWMVRDWDLAYPGTAREGLRADLASHLDTLLSQPMQQVDLNNDLVTQVQGVLTQMPLAQRVYEGILASPAAKALPKWRLTDVGGPAIARAFVRSSGKPLNDGIEGIYTYDGFNDVFLPEALGVAAQIQRESWVLGPSGETDQTDDALLAMSRDVLDLYYNDYVGQYDQILGEIDIIPLESLSHAVEVTNILSGPTSPILNVLTAIDTQTRLTAPPPAPPGAADTAAAIGGDVAGASLKRLQLSPQKRILLEALTSTAAPGSPPRAPGAYVEDRFDWLHQLVTRPEGQPSQLDALLQTLTEVYQELSKLNFAGGFAAPQAEATALVRFQDTASRLSGPMQRWAKQIGTGSSGIAADGTRAGINARWQADILPFCLQASKSVYPFDRRAQADISLQDFTRLFAPGGMLDAFFTQNLAKFVNMRSRPWSWQPANGTDLGISQAVLTKFQEAAEIREAFFAAGPTPSVAFQMLPEALDPDANAITLEIDGQSLSYRHRDGQPRPMAVTWPGEVGLGRVTFRPTKPGSENTLLRDGPWAFFRLLDAAEVRKTDVSDRKRVIFNIGGRIAIFQMQSGSILNPFGLPALSKFTCPESF